MENAFSVLLLCFLLASCGAEKTVEAEKTTQEQSVDKSVKESEIVAPKVNNTKYLIQHWVHSREEQKNPDAEEQIFRPAKSRDFPPSRFRQAYKFSEGGECLWMALDSADRHHFKPGKWEIDSGDEIFLKITAETKANSFRIVEVSKGILRLIPVNAER